MYLNMSSFNVTSHEERCTNISIYTDKNLIEEFLKNDGRDEIQMYQQKRVQQENVGFRRFLFSLEREGWLSLLASVSATQTLYFYC